MRRPHDDHGRADRRRCRVPSCGTVLGRWRPNDEPYCSRHEELNATPICSTHGTPMRETTNGSHACTACDTDSRRRRRAAAAAARASDVIAEELAAA